MRHLIIATILVAASLVPGALPLSAQAGPILLDTIPVLGSRVSSDLSVRTRGVQIWTREDIARLPARTVEDVLGWSTGVELAARSPGQADVSLRGAGFEQVLVLVDGVRVSDAQTGHFHLNLTVPLERVERIEILRGPAAALYGSDAVGGVVNVVTRRDVVWGGRIETGSFGTLQGAVHGGTELPGGASLGFAAEHGTSDGHREGTDWDRRLLSASLRAPVGGGQVVGDAGIARRAFGAEDFYAPFPSFETTRTRTASLGWRAFGASGVRVEPRLSWRSNDDDFILVRDDPALYRNEHSTTRLQGEVVMRSTIGPHLTVSGGVEAARDRLESGTLGDRADDRRAVFGEAAFTLVEDLDATVGLRYDDHERWGGFTSPSIGLALQADPRVRVRASTGRSFRGPSWTERHYQDPAHEARADLRPERSSSTEVGAQLDLAEPITVAVTYFRRKSRDMIDWARPAADADAVWETMNVNEALFRGVEMDGSWLLDPLTTLQVGASYLSLESDAAAGLESKYALRPLVDQFHLGVRREMAPGVHAAVRGTRARRAGERSYGLLDVRLEGPFPGGSIFLDGRNLTRSDHVDITGNPVPGRALYLGLRIGG